MMDLAPQPPTLLRSHEAFELLRIDVGDGPEGNAVFRPADDTIAIGRVAGGRRVHQTRNWNRRHADEVRMTTIDQRRNGFPADDIDAPADQWKILLGKVDDPRCLRNTPAEPRFDGVAV